jgi:hypothetical protein
MLAQPKRDEVTSKRIYFALHHQTYDISRAIVGQFHRTSDTSFVTTRPFFSFHAYEAIPLKPSGYARKTNEHAQHGSQTKARLILC